MIDQQLTLPPLLGAVAVIALLLVIYGRRGWTIFEGQVGLLYRNGQFDGELGPGRHRRFDPLGHLALHQLPSVPVTTARPALTVMSKDQFSFRVSVSLTVRISDARTYQANRDAPETVGKLVFAQPAPSSKKLDADFAEAFLTRVSQRTLEEFLADPAAGLAELAAQVSAPGLMLEEVRITEVQVPPEVRKMFTEVERARREGLAQLERSRSEQASLRALANAARALQDNPRLAELRMWQLMEAAKGNKTFVLGKPIDPVADPGSGTS